MNMPILTQFGNSEQSMTSLEISELVQSRHDVVKKSIERLCLDAAIVQPPLVDEQSIPHARICCETQLYALEKVKR